MTRTTRTFAQSLLLVSLLSCGGDDPGTTEPDPPRAESISVAPTSLTFTFLGQTITVGATVQDQFARTFSTTVSWSSSDASVATVNASGVVTAVSNGTASITASAGSLSASASVTVQQEASQVSVVSGGSQSATVGQALTDPVVVAAQDQGGAAVAGATVTFSVASGGGSVSSGSVTADGDGVASTNWTLGTASGLQELAVGIQGSNAGTTAVTATAMAAPAASLVKTSGDGQTGTVNLALTNPVVVTVADDFGNGVSGKTVTFAVTGGGGSVSPSQVTTGEDGTAQTTWTMGSTLGAASLQASSEGLPPVTFTANTDPAKADLTASEPVTDPANPTSLQTIEVTSTVTNGGHLPTGGGFRVALLIDGTEAASDNLAALDVGESAVATFTVGPLGGGSHTFRVEVDADGTVDESDESNNGAQVVRTVATSQQITAGTPVSGISASEGTEFLYSLEVLPSQPGTMTVNISGGTGDVDLYVHYGNRPAHRDDYECQSGNPDTNEQCVFNAAEPGTYHILLYAWADYSGANMVANTGGPVVPFDIEVVFIDRGTAEQDAAFEAAAERWMDIITSDIPSQSFAAQPIDPNTCTQGQPRIDDEIDDVRIYVRVDSIDGAGGTLASAGPCILRGLKHHPVVGVMTFDEVDMADFSNQTLTDVVLHEMGHVLGIGTIWDADRWDLLRNPSLPSSAGADTHFVGERAMDAFDDLGGSTTYTLGAKVPVENSADQGSADAHWRESILGQELMTPSYNGGITNPVSILTIASLADIGYRVDMTQADAFSRSYRAPERGAENRPALSFGNDIRTGRLMVVDQKGGIREIIRY